MEIYIDSADIEEIKSSIDAIDGITTNPSLIKKGFERHKSRFRSLEEYIKKIIALAGERPVSLEINAIDKEKIVSQAEALVSRFKAKNIVVKIPVSADKERAFESISAIKAVEKKGIKVNCTLVMNTVQAVMAANAGASYISIFVGRIDDYIREKKGISFEKNDYFHGDESINGIRSGVDAVAKAVKAVNKKSRIIAASIRNKRQANEIAYSGADIITMPFAVLADVIGHEKTIQGARGFIRDSTSEYNRIL